MRSTFPSRMMSAIETARTASCLLASLPSLSATSPSLASANGEFGIFLASRRSSLRTSPAVVAIACATEAAIHDPPSPGDCGMAIGRQHDADGGRHLQRFPDTRRHAPADQLGAIAHRTRRGIALVPAECLRALRIARAQLLAGVGNVLDLVAIRIAAQAQFHRIELERDGELVPRAFDAVNAGRRD